MFMFFSLQFSKGLNKLFVQQTTKKKGKKQLCPVKFETAIPAQFAGQFYIRAHVSFKNLVAQRESVVSCPNDAHMGQLMQCEHPDAVDEQCGIHQTIRFPLDCCKGGVLSTTTNFKFVCLSSDSSINRRPIQLNFWLEDVGYARSFSLSN